MKQSCFSGFITFCIIFLLIITFISSVNALEIPGLVKASCSTTCSSILISYQENIENGGWEGIFQAKKDNSVLFNTGSYADSMFIWQTSMKNVAFITQNATSDENAKKAIAIVNDYKNGYYPDMVSVVVLSDSNNDGDADTATFSESFIGSKDAITVKP